MQADIDLFTSAGADDVFLKPLDLSLFKARMAGPATSGR